VMLGTALRFRGMPKDPLRTFGQTGAATAPAGKSR